MEIEFMWKDSGSGTGDCPSISRVIEGPAGYVVVGKQLDAETLAKVRQVGPDEVASFVPANVLDRLRDLG